MRGRVTAVYQTCVLLAPLQPERPVMTNNPNNRNTHIVILLDRSGSMESIAGDIVGGFNQFMRGQAEAGTDARVTFVQFDTEDPQEVIVAGAPIAEIVPLTRALSKAA